MTEPQCAGKKYRCLSVVTLPLGNSKEWSIHTCEDERSVEGNMFAQH